MSKKQKVQSTLSGFGFVPEKNDEKESGTYRITQ